MILFPIFIPRIIPIIEPTALAITAQSEKAEMPKNVGTNCPRTDPTITPSQTSVFVDIIV